MTREKLKQYIQKVQDTKIDDIDMGEFKDPTIEVMNHYDRERKTSQDEVIYIFILFHKYICQLYANKISATFSTTGPNCNYKPNTNQVEYTVNPIVLMQSPLYLIFKTMHENRHAVQNAQFRKDPSDILEIDPLSIVILKEYYIWTYKPELYTRNHSSFIMENDANVCAYQYLKDFISEYLPDPEKFLQAIQNFGIKERENYISRLQIGSKIGEFKFASAGDGTLPVVYEADRVFKRNVKPQDVGKYPLLKLLCKDDGKLKSYADIINDREQAIQAHKNDGTVTRRDSRSEFKEDNQRDACAHITEIYTLIINSDPMLYLEDCLNHGKNLQMRRLLEGTPELMDVYAQEIRTIVGRYIDIKNYEKYRNIFNRLNNQRMVGWIEKKVEGIVRRDIRRMCGINITNDISPDEDIVLRKDVATLEQEETHIIDTLTQNVQQGNMEEETLSIYRNILKQIYDRYKKESRDSNPEQISSSNTTTNTTGLENPNTDSNDSQVITPEDLGELGNIIPGVVDAELLGNEAFIAILQKYKEFLISEADVKKIADLFRKAYLEQGDGEVKDIDEALVSGLWQ